MKIKIFTVFAFFLFILSSCQNKDNDLAMVSQRFVHKYGFDISEKEWKTRNKNGQIITVLKNKVTLTNTYKEGVLHGSSTYTFPHSSIIQERNEYEDGILVKKTIYEPSGLPINEYAYDNDGKKIMTTWDKKGVPLSMEEYDNDLLSSARYYTSENEIEASITDGNGTRIKRDRDGKLISQEKVENGKIIARTSYHPNGEVQSKTSFLDYKFHGIQETFSPEGELLTHVNWDQGKIDGLMLCYRSGKIFAEVPYENGKKQGVEKEYCLDGSLAKEIHWENNKRHGSTRNYYSDYTDIQWYWQGVAVDLRKFQMLELRTELMAEINGETESYSIENEESSTL